MEIKILGGGCTKCDLLYKHVNEALVELDITTNIKKVQDYDQIVAHGVMSTPALWVDGEVLSSGRVLTTKKVVDLLSNLSMSVK